MAKVTDRPSGIDSGVVSGRDTNMTGDVVVGRDYVQNFQVVSPPTRTRLFQLPPDIEDFTNQDAAVAELTRLLRTGGNGHGTAIVVTTIAGKAGIGKSALATRVAHRVADYFSDGQLYADLRCGDGKRRDPGLVLGEFLLELGASRSSIPDDLGLRAARYRAQLAGRRFLVVLDNAADEAQVRMLLPGSAGCAALITSRAELSGLSTTRRLTLEELDLDESVELMARIAGRERVQAELDKAREVVRLCGHLPLAVRIASGKLASRRHWTLSMLASRLRPAHSLMEELRLHDLEVRASFKLSYDDLHEEERRAFRLLGLLDAPDFTTWVAAALLDCGIGEAEDLLDRLVEAQVLEGPKEPQAGEVRYRFHHLLRAFARDHPLAEPFVHEKAALLRVFAAYVTAAEFAASVLEPGAATTAAAHRLPTHLRAVSRRIVKDPGAWFAAERVNLISIVEQAYVYEADELVWRLARSLIYFFKLRNHWSDWRGTQDLARRAARRAGDRQARASALRSLGDVATQAQQIRRAIRRFKAAIRLFRTMDDSLGEARLGEAWSCVGLGNAYLDELNLPEARYWLTNGLGLFESIGDRRGMAWASLASGIGHRAEGQLRQDAGQLRQAESCFQDSLLKLAALGDRRGVANCLISLGIVCRERAEFDSALDWFNRARLIFRELADHHAETYILLNLGHLYREKGRFEEAIAALESCLAAFREFRERDGEAWAFFNIGMVWQAQGRTHDAIARFHRCYTLFHDAKDRRGKGWTLLGLGEAYRRQRRHDDALGCFEDALTLLEEIGDQPGQAKVRSRMLALHEGG